MKGHVSSQTHSLPQWLAARKELLAREKAFTRQKDALNDVTIDESVKPLELNYRSREELLAARPASWAWVLEAEQPVEVPGYSCFLRDGESVFHTYSTYSRGSEQIGGGYALLDMTALGRQEEWEKPKGPTGKPLPAVPTFEGSVT